MLDDELLKFRFKKGDVSVLAVIYDKYGDYLLTIAMALLNDHGLAEDVLHDVFVSLAKSVTRFRIQGSLKAYLAISVVNRCRDLMRKQKTAPATLNNAEQITASNPAPDSNILFEEQSARLNETLARIPTEQREIVVLKINAGLKFRQIAALQNISINTAQARYRYGIDKLRSLLDSEV
jgi:RNA polymerase sigma-70 factor (ECF subfamily)